MGKEKKKKKKSETGSKKVVSHAKSGKHAAKQEAFAPAGPGHNSGEKIDIASGSAETMEANGAPSTMMGGMEQPSPAHYAPLDAAPPPPPPPVKPATEPEKPSPPAQSAPANDSREAKPKAADGGTENRKQPGKDAEKAPIAWQVRDPEAFAVNLAKMMEEAGKAASAWLKPRGDEESRAVQYGQNFEEVTKTLSKVSEYWLTDPKRALHAQTHLFSRYLDLWNTSIKRMAGEEAGDVITPERGDGRFKDPEWEENQFFNFVKQAYLITSGWASDLVEQTQGLDDHTKHKAIFYTQQLINSLSPTNFPALNPEVLRETFESNAENFVKGVHALAEDIERGGGELRLRQADDKGFEVGRNVANTPGKVVSQNDICQVIQYEPTTEKVRKRPLVIVPPWINKFYILDLNEKKSFIRWCVDQGHTVFVISWVNPDERQAGKSFENYAREGIIHTLDVVEDITGERGSNLIGYCVGGTLLAVTLALMARSGDTRAASATFLTTQVDFTHAGDLKVFVDEEQVSRVEETMAEKGYLDGAKMATAFNLLRSRDLIWPYVVNNYMRGKDPMPFDLLYWNADSTRMPAANHSFYLRNCYLENNLSRGKMELAGEKLDLGEVTIPIYNLATREDHIAPAKSAYLGSQFFGGKVEFVLTGSGHIAGVVNPPAANKYQYWTGPKPVGDIDDWLPRAEEHPGSWWIHWDAWLKEQDDTMVEARTIGSAKFPPIEAAPGSYVKVKI